MCDPGGVEYVLLRFRGLTDACGVAELSMPKGTYEIRVWHAGYEAPPTTVEVFEDGAVLHRQEALDEVQRTIDLLGDLVAAPPEATIYHVSSSEPWGG
mgnify:CR=1 FL=1